MSKLWLIDTLERVAWTATQGFAATFILTQTDSIAGGFVTDLKVAGLAALVSACKCVVAAKVGERNTAQAIPGGTYTYQSKS